MTTLSRQPSGYLTLLAILIITTVAVSIVVTMTLFAADDIIIANGLGTQYQTQALANGCAELALELTANDPTVSIGDTVKSFGEINSECDYSIEANTTDTGADQRIIRSTGTFLTNNSKTKVEITVAIGPAELYTTPTILSWRYVGDF